MSNYRTIFLIADPSMRRTPAFDEAEALARRSGARLHIALFDYSQAIAAAGLLNKEAGLRGREGYMAVRRHWLQQETDALKSHGLKVSCDVAWAHPLHEEILTQVTELSPDLVIKDVHHESLLRRVLLTPLDWQLLRLCPAPLLLVNPNKRTAPKRIIAAIDPVRSEAGNKDFNEKIIRSALGLAMQTDAEVHLAYAFLDLTSLQLVSPEGQAIFSAELYESMQKSQKAVFNQIADEFGVPKDRRHFLTGPASMAIADLASDSASDVVVLGTVHRTGIDRLLMGSSAERILEHLPCSVLAIKPSGFPEYPRKR